MTLGFSFDEGIDILDFEINLKIKKKPAKPSDILKAVCSLIAQCL